MDEQEQFIDYSVEQLQSFIREEVSIDEAFNNIKDFAEDNYLL